MCATGDADGSSHMAAKGETMGQLTEAQRAALADACRQHSVSLCYLFGSRATGHDDSLSDWDVGVVFGRGRFPRARTERWLSLVAQIEQILDTARVDLLFLEELPARLQWEAIGGRLLYAREPAERADFEESVMRRWMDLQPFIRAQERDEEEAVLDGHFFAERPTDSVSGQPDPAVGAPPR